MVIYDIKDLMESKCSLLEEIAGRSSQQGVVYFTIDSFKFEKESTEEEITFTVDNLKTIYPSFANKISGTIEHCSYEESREVIDLYVYCGAYHWECPTSKNDVEEEYRAQAEINLHTFWNEIEKNFTMPPTDVFIHHGDFYSSFGASTYWNFCYIYLNRNTNEGIILSGDCGD